MSHQRPGFASELRGALIRAWPRAPPNAPETLPAAGVGVPLAPVAMARPQRSSASSKVLATVAVTAALWWGQRFLIPLATGLMLAVLLMSLARLLERLVRSAVAASVLTQAIVPGALAAGA